MIETVRTFVVPMAYECLPSAMASPSATAMLIAIGYQESRFTARHQVGGPAMGFWMFEQAGIAGVLGHSATKDIVRDALKRLRYPYVPTPFSCQTAVQHNDALACVFARLLLWTLPGPLPTQSQEELGWALYLAAWRPGKPRPESWAEAWAHGWALPS